MKEKTAPRDRILEAAEAVFSDKGYHDAAVDDIVRRADMSKGGVYFHFSSKERLFFAVMDHLAERLIKRIRRKVDQQTTALGRLDAALTTVVESLGTQRRLAKLLLVQGYSMGKAFEKKRMEVHSRFASLIKEILDQAVEEGAIQQVNTNIASQVWLGAINEVLIQWLYTGGPAPAKESLPEMRRLLLGGLGVNTSLATAEG
jgi:TetR/AcrR family fatty acid metabolism transcriptional regulator